MLTHEALVKALLLRYDHFSAGVVAKEVVGLAGLEKKDGYEKAEIKEIVAVLEKYDSRIAPVLEALQGPPEEVAPAKKAEEAPDEKKAPAKKKAKK